MTEVQAPVSRVTGEGLRYRPATPQDVNCVVPLMYSSGPAAFRYVFSQHSADQAERFLHDAFVQGDGEFGYRNHVVVTRDGEVLAAGALWGREAVGGFTRAAVRRIVAFYGPLAAVAVAWRGLRLERVLKAPGKGAAYIAHIGVDADCRGQGIGLAMMRFLIDQSRLRGYRRAVLDVAVDNRRALTLYQVLGFTVLSTHPGGLSSTFGEMRAHHHMGMDIEP